MSIFVIADLHLSFETNKPMNVFGENWEDHEKKIENNWRNKVNEKDLVILPGDFSWAMKLEDTFKDFQYLNNLPGKKLLLKGNHDYWWGSISRVREAAPDDSFYFLQNDCVRFGNLLLAGSRGWTCPGSADFTEHDEKLYLREAERFRLAFREVKARREEGDRLFVLMHYPPMNLKKEPTLFTELFEENGVEKVVFGHLHGAVYYPVKCERAGIEYFLTSCDKIKFSLMEIADFS